MDGKAKRSSVKKRCPECAEWIDLPNDGSTVCCPYCGKTVSLPLTPHPSDVKLSQKDVEFTVPTIATSVYNFYRALVWISTFIAVVIGICVYKNNQLAIVGVCVAGAIWVAFHLLLARIAYELIVVVFEQLRVMRQLRDLLEQKLK